MINDLCDRVARRNYELHIMSSQVFALLYRLKMYRVQYFKMEINFYYKRSSRKIADKNHHSSNRSRSSRLRKGPF